MRDLAIFQIKLLPDCVKDVVVAQIALAAAAVEFVFRATGWAAAPAR